MFVWTTGSDYIVAETAKEANDTKNAYFDCKIEEKDWRQVASSILIIVKRNPYTNELITFQKLAIDWINENPWNHKLKTPWFIIANLEDGDTIDHSPYEEEEEVILLGVRRACPCDSNEDCAFCHGEKTVTRWVPVTSTGETYSLSVNEVDEVFTDLDSYAVLLEAGYKVSRE